MAGVSQAPGTMTNVDNARSSEAPCLQGPRLHAASRVCMAGPGQLVGYTRGMKTAVSVPDDLFAQVDRLAKRSRRSRSEVYSAALREYVARHAPDEVTAGLDAVLADLGQPGAGDFTANAARRTLETSEW